jgi:acetyl esterase/lipase
MRRTSNFGRLARTSKLLLSWSIIFAASAMAQGTPYLSLHVEAHDVPVPDSVSPELQGLLGKHSTRPEPMTWPTSNEGYRRLDVGAGAEVKRLLRRLPVAMEKSEIAGVNCYILTPRDMPASNRDRLLVLVHGGGYVLWAGESGMCEGILMAHYAKMPVIGVDYRMAPDFPYPAAVDDVMAVWRALASNHDPAKMGIFGSSAGGGLILCLVQRAIKEKSPIPAAIAPGTPWSDLSPTGDSYYTVGSGFRENYQDGLATMARQYARNMDLKDARVSPVYGSFSGFPPAILTSGTRDELLSCTVRVNQKLRQAGVETRLQIIEGMGHAVYLDDDLPESKLVFTEIAEFLDTHLKR